MPDRFYIWEDDERSGPYTERQVERMLEDELISFDHECEDADTGKAVALDDLFEVYDREEEGGNEDDWDDEEGEDEEGTEWEYEEGDDGDESESEWEYEEEDDGDEGEWEDEDDEEDSGLPANTELYHGHPTFLRYVGGFALVALSAAFGLWLGPKSIWFFVGGSGLAVLTLIYIFIDRASRDYVVTPKRIELTWGLFARSSHEVRIEDIRTINVKKSGFSGMLGVGTVEFSSTGDGVDVTFTDIWAAQKVKLLVRKLQDEWE